MALLTTIDINLIAKTAVLTCTVSGNRVEIITYTNSTQNVTFTKRDPLTISGTDFMSYTDQIKIFQTAIIFNFSPNQFATVPFGQCDANEIQDVGSQTWNLTVFSVDGSNVVEYSAALATLDVALIDRNPDKTITFPEWIETLVALNHYRLSVRNYFNL